MPRPKKIVDEKEFDEFLKFASDNDDDKDIEEIKDELKINDQIIENYQY